MSTRANIIFGIVMAALLGVWAFVLLRRPVEDDGRSDLVRRVNVTELRDLQVKEVGDPVVHAYGYEHNEYREIPSLAGAQVRTMSEGRLPVFGYRGFKFVVIHKAGDSAWGFAWGSGPAPDDVRKLAFEPKGDGLWVWSLDLAK